MATDEFHLSTNNITAHMSSRNYANCFKEETHMIWRENKWFFFNFRCSDYTLQNKLHRNCHLFLKSVLALQPWKPQHPASGCLATMVPCTAGLPDGSLTSCLLGQRTVPVHHVSHHRDSLCTTEVWRLTEILPPVHQRNKSKYKRKRMWKNWPLLLMHGQYCLFHNVCIFFQRVFFRFAILYTHSE